MSNTQTPDPARYIRENGNGIEDEGILDGVMASGIAWTAALALLTPFGPGCPCNRSRAGMPALNRLPLLQNMLMAACWRGLDKAAAFSLKGAENSGRMMEYCAMQNLAYLDGYDLAPDDHTARTARHRPGKPRGPTERQPDHTDPALPYRPGRRWPASQAINLPHG